VTNILERLKSALADRYAIQEEIGAGGMATVYERTTRFEKDCSEPS